MRSRNYLSVQQHRRRADYYFLVPHLAAAAFLAISLRFLGLRLSALATPPFKPPLRPKATAAGSLAGPFWVSDSPVAFPTMEAARELTSLGPGFWLMLPA